MAHRQEVDMIDVRAAAMAGNQSVRGRALAAARGGGSSLRQRLEALAIAASPCAFAEGRLADRRRDRGSEPAVPGSQKAAGAIDPWPS